MYKKGVLTLVLTIGLTGAAHATIQLPFKSGKAWYVCNGYHGYGVHDKAPVLDLSTDPSSPVKNGCDPATGQTSAGQTVLAPVAGDVIWFQSDMLCITTSDKTRSIGIGHLDPSQPHVQNGPIQAGEKLGVLAPPNQGNNYISHIHIQGHSVPYCNGNLVPFDDAHGMRFAGGHDLPWDHVTPNQWSDRILGRRNENGIPYPIGTLIQVKDENDVFLVATEDRESAENPSRIVKRLIDSPAVFDLNKLRWTHIVEITPQDKALYLRGTDITGKVTTDGLTEGELIRLDGKTEVYVVSNGELHWLNMTAEEFRLLGYSFSLVRNTSVSYPKGKEIRYAAFMSSLPPTGPGPVLTETPGPTDKRHYAGDPWVLFYKGQIIVASPSDIRFFDAQAKIFLGENTDARGNMELSDGLIHAFGCVPEYQQGLPTGFAYQVLMRIDPANGQTVSKTLLGKRIMFACNDNISFFIIGDVVYVRTYGMLYAFDKNTGEQRWNFSSPYQYSFQGMSKTSASSIVLSTLPLSSNKGAILVSLDPATQKETCRFLSGHSAMWYASPIEWQGVLYYGEEEDGGYNGSYLYALDRTTCKPLWERYFKSSYHLKAVGPYGAYLKIQGDLASLDLTTGDLRWSQPLGDVLASPVIRDWQEVDISPDGNVYVLTTDLVILDGQTGKELSRYVLNVSPWPIVSNIAMDNKTIAFIAGKNGDGELRVFKAPDLPPLPVVPGSVPNGGVCTEGKDCASTFCFLGPDVRNYCIAVDKSCGLKGTDGLKQEEVVTFNGQELRCVSGNVYVPANAPAPRSVQDGAACNLAANPSDCGSNWCYRFADGKGYCINDRKTCALPGTGGLAGNERTCFQGVLYECRYGAENLTPIGPCP